MTLKNRFPTDPPNIYAFVYAMRLAQPSSICKNMPVDPHRNKSAWYAPDAVRSVAAVVSMINVENKPA